MTVFVDTAALLAILDADDQHHSVVQAAFRSLIEERRAMETSSYVLVESHALVQARLGMGAVRAMVRDLMPLIQVVWVDAEIHRAAVSAVLAANRRRLSLVDCVSFEVMNRRGLMMALTIDPHFREQGFEVLPASA